MRNLENWVVASFAATGCGAIGYAGWIAIEIGGAGGFLGWAGLIAFAAGTFFSGEE